MNLGICTRLENLAPSQYSGWTVNSLVSFNGQTVAFGQGGVYELGGETDNGTTIAALVDLPTTDFGLFEEKRIEAVRMAGQSVGGIKLTFQPDETAGNEQTVTIGAGRSGEAEHTRTATLRRIKGGHGTYWRVRAENVNGEDFSLDGVALLLAMLKRKTW